MIEVKNLTKYYGSKMGVEDVSFTIQKGEIVGLLGPNGAGKSTIMKMINGYFPPTSGTILVDGHNVVEEPREDAACIGFLPEIPPLYVEMVVEDYLMFIAQIRGVPRAERKEHIGHVMELASISHVRDRLIKNLSKGYRQRVGLAQALVNLPEVLMLDEPTVGLDPKQITEVRDLIKELSKEHTVILSSHILSEINAICEKVIIINRGRLVTVDTVVISLLLFVCLSLYFLIVNLMTTRAYIRRCLAGVGISVLLVTLLSYLRIVPVDDMAWLTGSRAGNYIVDTVHTFIAELSGLWVEHSELFLVLVFPWLYAYLFHTRRVFRKAVGLLFIALALALILMTHSISAFICVLAVTLIFFLLMDHKWLAVGIVSLPTVVCGGLWLTYLYPVSDAVQTILSRSRLFKTQLRESLWEMVLDHPAGIGVGEDAFAAVYPQYAAPDLGAVGDSGTLLFEVLLNYGWVGLILFAIVLFLYAQKSMTCLRHTAATKDRAVILGGLTSLVGALIFGTVRSFITAPRVFFTLLLVVAICSAYENVVFDESDVLCADGVGSPVGEDRIWRKG